MTRFAVLASVALAASLVSAAPTPGLHEVQEARQFNWEGAISSWYHVRPGVRTVSCSNSHTHSHHKWHKWHTKTRTATPPAANSAPTISSVVEATSTSSAAPEPTAAAPKPASSVVEAPSALVETSSVLPATSTAVPTTSADPATSATPIAAAAPTTTAAPATKPATTSEPVTTAASSGNANIDAYMKGHNDIRAQHGASPLTWADDLAAAAAKWAGNCVWEHSGGKVGKFGENLAAGTGLTAAAAVKMWTDEASDYDPANPQYSHFTQVVWKATSEVGCAVTSCTNLLAGWSGAVDFHVCEYRAPGNVIGQFAQNVQV